MKKGRLQKEGYSKHSEESCVELAAARVESLRKGRGGKKPCRAEYFYAHRRGVFEVWTKQLG